MANLIRRRSSSPGRQPEQPLVAWEAFLSPGRLRRDIDRLVDEVFSGALGSSLPVGEFVPSLEMTESDKEYVMTAELPGLTEKDVHIDVDDDNVLTIRGEKKSETRESRGGVEFSERTYGQFVRTIQLPRNLEPNKIEARMENGILEIHIPKTAQAGAHEIPIGSKQESKQLAEGGTAKAEAGTPKAEGQAAKGEAGTAKGEKAGGAKAPGEKQQQETPAR